MSAYVGLRNNPFFLLGEEDNDEITDTSTKKVNKKEPSKASSRRKKVESHAEPPKAIPQGVPVASQSLHGSSSRKKPAKLSEEPPQESVPIIPEQPFKVGRDQGRPPPNSGSRRRGIPSGGYPKGESTGNRRLSTNRKDSIKKDVVGKGSWGNPVEPAKDQKQDPVEELREQEETDLPQAQEQAPEKKAPLMTLEQYMSEMRSNAQNEDATPAKSRGIYVSSEDTGGAMVCVPSKSKSDTPKPKDHTKKKNSGAKNRSQRNLVIFEDKISVTNSIEHHKGPPPGGPSRRYNNRNDEPRSRDYPPREPRGRRPPRSTPAPHVAETPKQPRDQ